MPATGPEPTTDISDSLGAAKQLADEQAALRREVARVMGLPLCTVARFASDADVSIVVGAIGDHPQQAGVSVSLDQPSAAGLVRKTGRPARVDGPRQITGTDVRSMTVTGTAAAPIIVDGGVWGAIAVGTDASDGLPGGTEERLTQFTELVATAISNAETRTELRRLADEHAALRRVAVLVASGAEEATIFHCVCEEAARLFDASTSNLVLWRNGVRITTAGWSLRGVHVKPGTRMEIEPDTLDGRVYRTASPSRIDSYASEPGAVAAMLRRNGIKAQVAAPVMVDGEVWGVLIVGTDKPEPLPAGTEVRLAAFTELIATAVSNAAAKAELLGSRARIVEAADEQRRRVVRDLHDGAQQRLVHTVITLRQAIASGADPPIRSLVEQGLEHAENAIVELGELAHGIHPAILTHRGLAAAVEGLADRGGDVIGMRGLDDIGGGARRESAVDMAGVVVS